MNPSVSYDPATGSTYLFWDEILEGPLTNEGISAQKFNSTGVRQWGDNGLAVQPLGSSAVINVASVFTAAGPLVAWSSEPTFAQSSIYGAKVDPSGAIICRRFLSLPSFPPSRAFDMRLSSQGLALAASGDGRNDGGDIYAQDIKPDCSLGQ